MHLPYISPLDWIQQRIGCYMKSCVLSCEQQLTAVLQFPTQGCPITLSSYVFWKDTEWQLPAVFHRSGIPAGYQKKKNSLLFLLWVLGVLWELISVMKPFEPLDGQIEVDCGFWVKAAKTVKAVWRCQIRWICFVVWTLVQTETPRQVSNCGELCGREEGKWQHLTCKRISLKVYKYTSLLGLLIFQQVSS